MNGTEFHVNVGVRGSVKIPPHASSGTFIYGLVGLNVLRKGVDFEKKYPPPFITMKCMFSTTFSVK